MLNPSWCPFQFQDLYLFLSRHEIYTNHYSSTWQFYDYRRKCAFQCAHISPMYQQIGITTHPRIASHSLTYLVTFGHLLQQPARTSFHQGRSVPTNSPFPRPLHREDRPLVQVPKPWRGDSTPRRRLKGLDHDWIMMFRSCHQMKLIYVQKSIKMCQWSELAVVERSFLASLCIIDLGLTGSWPNLPQLPAPAFHPGPRSHDGRYLHVCVKQDPGNCCCSDFGDVRLIVAWIVHPGPRACWRKEAIPQICAVVCCGGGF